MAEDDRTASGLKRSVRRWRAACQQQHLEHEEQLQQSCDKEAAVNGKSLVFTIKGHNYIWLNCL